MPDILIDAGQVEQRLLALARHGAHAGTGVWRTVYSPEWVAAADLYASWCAGAGLAVRRDAVGNVWGRLEGTAGVPPSSAVRTWTRSGPAGYDGALRALAGLIAIAALKAQCGQPRRTLEAVALCEEEGSRFPGAGFLGGACHRRCYRAGRSRRRAGLCRRIDRRGDARGRTRSGAMCGGAPR